MRCPSLESLPPPPPGKFGWPWTEESPHLPDTLPDHRPWPRVSIVTPSLNQGEYLEETIRSVLLQGYPNIEYIIMDGGSTDGSVEIIRKYQPWLACWVSAPDSGQTHAINKGWARASGDIQAYINSDDVYFPGSLAAVVSRFLQNPSLGMVYGTARIIDREGKELRSWNALPFEIKTMLTKENIVPQPAAFFSGDGLKRLGYLKEEFQMIMDYELAIRLGMHFPAACLPETLANFRDHSSSKTRTRSEAAAQELIQFATDLFAQNRLSPDLQDVQAATFGRFYYMLALGIVSQGKNQSARAVKPLLQSIGSYPLFALRRPIQTAYILKEAILGYFHAVSIRLIPRPDESLR